MSPYSTQYISRADAIVKLKLITIKQMTMGAELSDTELESRLNEYAYSGEHTEELGVLYNFRIEQHD